MHLSALTGHSCSHSLNMKMTLATLVTPHQIADHHWMTAYGLREIETQEEAEVYSGGVPALGELGQDSDETAHQGGSVSEGHSRQHSAASAERSTKSLGGSRQASAASKK